MKTGNTTHHEPTAACCTCNRREFLAASGAAAMIAAGLPAYLSAAEHAVPPGRRKEPARVRAVFLYPPSRTFAEKPDAWWSWPGNEFDAEIGG